MKVLVLNSGSSSLKTNIYEVKGEPPVSAPEPIWRGRIEWADDGAASVRVRNASCAAIEDTLRLGARGAAVERVIEMAWNGAARAVESPREIDVVGHRIVHGGGKFVTPVRLTHEVRAQIAEFAAVAPLHNQAEMEGVAIVEKKLGDVVQVGVFDTAFHSTMPEHAATYAVPGEWRRMGIRRYGFHGINHRYCAERAAEMLGRDASAPRIVTCHLGNGCSVSAVRGGKSIDTTMGFTPLEGLAMGTRSGSIDPAIVTYLIRTGKLSAEQIEKELNTRSGLLGVSGLSSDMREIVGAMMNGHAGAKLAFDVFVYRLRLAIGAMIAAMGGVDAIVFSGGIGENSSEVRAAACKELGFVGVTLDDAKNGLADGDADVAQTGSGVRVLVIAAQEDWAIARECFAFVGERGSGSAARAT